MDSIRDVPRASIYTSRPILVVGTLKSFDSATSTVLVVIDHRATQVPHAMLQKLRKDGLEKRFVEQELPRERAFQLNQSTMIVDGRPNPAKPQTRAVTGKIREDRQLLPISEFRPGDTVGVLYRMGHTPGAAGHVLNMSKLNPGQETNIEGPPISRKTLERMRANPDAITSSTRIREDLIPR